MLKESPIYVRQDFPRSALFRIDCDSPGMCVVRWQYPLPNGLWLAAALFAVIASVFSTVAVATLLAMPYPLRILGAIFFAMPAVITFVLLISFLLDDRSEGLTIYSDRIEHDAASTMTHYLFHIPDEWRYEFANTGIDGFVRERIIGVQFWRGRLRPCSDPVIYRSEIERLTYDEYGECPECIVICRDKAFCVGPYLHAHELRLVARAIQAWLHGQSPSQVYGGMLATVEASHSVDDSRRVRRDEVAWKELLQAPPKGYSIEQLDGDSDVVVIKFKSTTIRFETERLRCDRPLFITGRHVDVPYVCIDQIRETYFRGVQVDYVDRERGRYLTLCLKADVWLASLIAARVGKSVRRSKLSEGPRLHGPS